MKIVIQRVKSASVSIDGVIKEKKLSKAFYCWLGLKMLTVILIWIMQYVKSRKCEFFFR